MKKLINFTVPMTIDMCGRNGIDSILTFSDGLSQNGKNNLIERIKPFINSIVIAHRIANTFSCKSNVEIQAFTINVHANRISLNSLCWTKRQCCACSSKSEIRNQ